MIDLENTDVKIVKEDKPIFLVIFLLPFISVHG